MTSNPLYLTEFGSLTKGSVRLFFTETVPAWLGLLAVMAAIGAIFPPGCPFLMPPMA